MKQNGPSFPSAVVLGAGPAGLGTALGLGMNNYAGRVSVIEKNPRPGGLAGSFAWKDHTVDYGPHRLSPNLPAIRALAEEMLGPDCLVRKNQNGVQFARKLYQFPIRVKDWITPLSLWQIGAFGASFTWAKIAWIPRRFVPDTFESAIVRKFGRRFYRRIARPMAEKVWGHTREIDPAFVNQRFASVHPWEVLKKMIIPKQELHPSTFFYPRRGFGQLWDNICTYLTQEDHDVHFESMPTAVEVEGGRVTRVCFRTPSGEKTIEGDNLHVISTIPLVTLLDLIKGFDTERLKEEARAIRVRSMVLVIMEFDQPRTLPYRSIQFPEENVCFNRLVEQNEYSRETVAEGRSVVLADITLPRGSEDMARSDEDFIRDVRRDLKKLPYIRLERLKDTLVKRVEFAYVTPDVGTRRAIYAINHALKRIPNLELVGRFAAGEYDNSDYAVDCGITLARALTGRISRLDYLCALQDKKQRSIVV